MTGYTNLAELIAAAQVYLPSKDIRKLKIVFHWPCPDGAAGACAGWLLLGDEGASYIPFNRENQPPYDESLLKEDDVLFIDCAPTLADLQRMRAANPNRKVMVLDHHVSAQKELGDQPGCFFIMSHSGAVIAWHYFHGIDIRLPALYRLIEDRDIMRWAERDSSLPVDAAIKDLNPEYKVQFFARYLTAKALASLIEAGKAAIARDAPIVQGLIDAALSRQYTCPKTSKTYSVKCVGIEDDRLSLQVLECLKQQPGVDFAMTWYHEGDNVNRLSMRTVKDKAEVDLSVVSANIGGDSDIRITGGGHANKAGARIKGSPLDWFVREEPEPEAATVATQPGPAKRARLG